MKSALDQRELGEESVKKILYIASVLPALSATFIDREIRALAAAGYRIHTVSRATTPKGEVSDATLNYYSNTLYLDQTGIFRQLLSQLQILICKPLEWCKIVRLICVEKEVKGRRDRVRLLKHFLQAGYVYTTHKGLALSHIHAHFLNAPTSIALFLSILLKIPFSFTEHASNMFIDPLMFGTKLRLCKKMVTISEYSRLYLLKKYGNDLAGKIHIIHCGLDPENYASHKDEKKKPPVVLAVGRLVAMKGFSILLDACHLLKEKGRVFRCLIVGEGEEKDALASKITELGIDDLVILQGAELQERVTQFLHEASIFVLPSIITEEGRRDGIPVALMEAMAMELPVISTKIVGIPELVEHGIEGLLVEQKNPVQLAEAIEFFLDNELAGKEMGKNGRLKIARSFNIHHVPEKFQAIFA